MWGKKMLKKNIINFVNIKKNMKLGFLVFIITIYICSVLIFLLEFYTTIYQIYLFHIYILRDVNSFYIFGNIIDILQALINLYMFGHYFI